MTKTKRPTHESDAMSLFLSDSVSTTVAKKLLELEKKGLRGDQLFAATAISLSIERDPEFWKRFSDVVKFESELLDYLETLRREGKPVSRAFLEQVQRRYADEISPYKPKPWVIWKGAFDIELFELSKERHIIVKGQGFMFELPVE